MNPSEAASLIESAVQGCGHTWADIGAGDGTFTRALIERLGPECRVFAVDRDRRALARLEHWANQGGSGVTTVVADFRRPFELPGPAQPTLDGILLANALHFVRDPESVLARLVQWLRPGGRVVLIEYDRRGPNPWVPYPIPIARLLALAAAAGLSPPIVTETRRSAYGGNLYVATADRSSLGD